MCIAAAYICPWVVCVRICIIKWLEKGKREREGVGVSVNEVFLGSLIVGCCDKSQLK